MEERSLTPYYIHDAYRVLALEIIHSAIMDYIDALKNENAFYVRNPYIPKFDDPGRIVKLRKLDKQAYHLREQVLYCEACFRGDLFKYMCRTLHVNIGTMVNAARRNFLDAKGKY